MYQREEHREKVELCDKQTVLDYLWVYSHFNATCLYQSEELYCLEKGFEAITVLFNCLENVSKSITNDYNSNLQQVFEKIFDNGIITAVEHDFLNAGDHCIRKTRNLYAHANVAAINLVNVENGKEILWPLTEDDTSLLLCDKISDIIYNLILKMISSMLIDELKSRFSFSLDDHILACDIHFKILSAKELLILKGYPEDYISDDLNIPEDSKYRMVDNSPDVNIYEFILSQLRGEKAHDQTTGT